MNGRTSLVNESDEDASMHTHYTPSPPPKKKKTKNKKANKKKTYLTKGLCLCGSYWEGSISAQASALREECEALGTLRSKKWEEFLIF